MLNNETDAEKIANGTNLFGKFNKQIETHLAAQSTRFIASDRLTIADFVVFSTYMSVVQNEATPAPEIQATFEATMADTPKVKAYIATMKQEMATYLANRGAYPI